MKQLSIRASLHKGNFSLVVDEQVALDGITALFGPSGAGKTTLLRIIAGLEPAARGTMSFDETVWQDAESFVPPEARRIGYVFQDGRLFPHLSVRGNLEFAKRAGRTERFTEVTELLDLGALLARRPDSLSGGEKQRVAIGRALLSEPRLILMDEPLSSLDSGLRNEIAGYIERLPRAFGLPVLYVTHDRAELMRLADRVLLMAEGRVRAHGDVKSVVERRDLWPLTGRAAGGSLIEATVARHDNGMTDLAVDDQTLRVPGIDLAPGTAVRLQIPAREVAIAVEEPRALSIRNVLAARIESIEADESIYVELGLAIGQQVLRARITREAFEELGLRQQQPVYALIKSVLFEDFAGL